jgi:hypothetical protein
MVRDISQRSADKRSALRVEGDGTESGNREEEIERSFLSVEKGVETP